MNYPRNELEKTSDELKAAIAYIKKYRKIDEELHNLAPKDSYAYYATDQCLKYWNKAIEALERCSKTGYWIPIPYELDYGSDARCSNCREDFIDAIDYKFCPYCGAKMEVNQCT